MPMNRRDHLKMLAAALAVSPVMFAQGSGPRRCFTVAEYKGRWWLVTPGGGTVLLDCVEPPRSLPAALRREW
jgi:hypothetical protein